MAGRARALTALLLLAATGCASTPHAPAAVTPLEHLPAIAGDYFPIRSRSTGGLYHIYIRLPEGYAERPKQHYPSVYVLDGDSLYPLLAAEHLFMTIDDKVPDALVVGIAFGSFKPPVNRREHDFGEGSADFQRFLREELIPAVERRVRADPAQRMLVGQSRGGGFVLYSAFTEPDLFRARIASNPSFPAHRSLLLNSAPAPGARRDLKLAVVSGTNDRPQIRAGTLEWFAKWEQQRGPWSLKRIELQGGTHAADMPNAYRRAMRWVFED